MTILDPAHLEGTPVERIIPGRQRDLGDGMTVTRILPHARKRMVGPFIFLDRMGPVEFLSGNGADVLPHPHIGLSTLTYLFDGSMVHRDSTGVEQEILPGDVNWMTAGSGVVHSERTGEAARLNGQMLSGLQAWIALPRENEEDRASFHHSAGSVIPLLADGGVRARLVAGSGWGLASPVPVSSPLVYADVAMEPGGAIPVDAAFEERAIFVLAGDIAIDGWRHGPGALMILRKGQPVTVRAETAAHFILLGGEPLEGPRHIWWNFVSSSRQRIEQARQDWLNRRFDAVINDAEEFVPLPSS